MSLTFASWSSRRISRAVNARVGEAPGTARFIIVSQKFATESGKSKGQFYTPAEVSRILAQIHYGRPRRPRTQARHEPARVFQEEHRADRAAHATFSWNLFCPASYRCPFCYVYHCCHRVACSYFPVC